jgi:chaperonin GroES
MEIKSLIRNKVLVEISEAKTKTASGIFLSGEAIKKPLEGKVIMTGPTTKKIKVGDTVRYYDHCGVPIEYQGKECIFLKEEFDIIVIL